MEAILFKDGIEFKRAPYPNKDIVPIVGLEANLEWKLIIRDALPVYDKRTHNLVVTEDNSDVFHPTYTFLKQYFITYSTIKRANADIVTEVEQAEHDANASILTELGENKHTTLAIGALIDDFNGITPTPNQIAMMNLVNNKVAKIWDNDTEADAKKDIANADGIPDLDSNWTTS